MMPGNSDGEETKLLQQVVEQLRTMNGQIGEMKTAIDATNERLDATNQRLDATNQRLDATNQRLDATREELSGRMDQMRTELCSEIARSRTEAAQNLLGSEMRHATRVTEQTIATNNVYQMLVDRFELRDRVERCEQAIAELKRAEQEG